MQRDTLFVYYILLIFLNDYFQHFQHVVLPIWLLNSQTCDTTPPVDDIFAEKETPESDDHTDDLGIAQYRVAALLYIGQDQYIEKSK